MTPTYDNPLQVNRAFAATTDFATAADVTVGARVVIAGGTLKTHQVLSVRGVISTVGTGVITFGTAADPDRFGTFTLASGLAVGDAVDGVLALTEEGFRINGDEVDSVLIGFSGTAVAANLAVTAGFYY